MDKKNTTIGIVLLACAMGVMFFGPRFFPASPPPPPTPLQAPPTVTSDSPTPADPGTITTAVEPEAARALPPPAATGPAPLKAPVEIGLRPGEQPVSLANEVLEVHFTNFGGAIAEVALKDYPAHKNGTDPYLLNALHAAPALSLLGFAGADETAPYTLVAQTDRSITWQATIGGQVRVTRTYTLGDGADDREPYLIRHETTFENLTDQPLSTPALSWALGTAEPASASDPGQDLNVGAYNGDKAQFIDRTKFVPGFFARNLGGDKIEKAEIALQFPTVWASVKNQFFTTILTPDQPGTGVVAQRVEMPLVAGERTNRVGITGRMLTAPVRVEPHATATLGFDFYAGPKEYFRLERLDHDEDLVMDFGWFGFFSKLLLKLLKWLHSLFAASDWAWGWAIICTTLVLRSAMWPITASAARSAKRMAKIQAPMKELQEKYKDNRQKLNEEMLKLFKTHKVNPAGSCLPMFIQIPIFIGFFYMLRSASELRFAEFLWVPDLSAADTVARPFGFPLNIMPLLMGVSMVIQMRMTPTPTTDNASAKMMKFMPYFVTFICYNFSSGLALYWTASNVFSIFQQWVTNRRKDKDEPAAAKPVAPAPKLHRGLPVTKKKKR